MTVTAYAVLYVLKWLMLSALYASGLAVCVLAGMIARRGRPRMWSACLAGGTVAAASMWALIHFRHGGMAGVFIGPGILMMNAPSRHIGLVWLKRRLRRSGKPASGLWGLVRDDYWWHEVGRHEGPSQVPTELEAADTPGGRGTEPEASPAPAGRGTELEPAGGATHPQTDADRSPAPRGRAHGP